jgi:DNA-binding NarL/FixJ family response regulator
MALRVYLVEDSPLVFERLQESMEEDGAKVVGHADDATTAIAEIAALRPDAVVVDIALREGTGLHVLKDIGDFPETERPARVVLTNFNREWYRDAAKRLGAEYFFDKSSEIPEMLEVLRAMSPSDRHGAPVPSA